MDSRLKALVVLIPVTLAGCGDRRGGGAPGDASATHEIRITVMVPEGAPTVYLTGNLADLGPWDPAGLAMAGEGRERTATVTVPHGDTLEYKFTLGSWDREGLGPSGTVMPNFRQVAVRDEAVTQEIVDFKKDPREYIADWRGSGVEGTLVYWTDVPSAFLSEARHVEIWLPPGYEQDTTRRYRVLYMHDGQNLFDPRIANTGVDWGVDEAMMRGAAEGRFEPAIVVGVWNSSRRLPEYSPWHEGPQYARFLIEELMPRVNAEFRTLTGPENTFVMGSSMGGLLSYQLVKEHPDVFGACGCVSTHFPLSESMAAAITGGGSADEEPYILRDIARGDTVPKGVRFFFDHGTEGLDASYGPTHEAVRAWLLAQGLVEGRDFLVRAYPGATHSEASWRARLGDQLDWLLGRRD
jgi:enterochelin esterase-like enzyme